MRMSCTFIRALDLSSSFRLWTSTSSFSPQHLLVSHKTNRNSALACEIFHGIEMLMRCIWRMQRMYNVVVDFSNCALTTKSRKRHMKIISLEKIYKHKTYYIYELALHVLIKLSIRFSGEWMVAGNTVTNPFKISEKVIAWWMYRLMQLQNFMDQHEMHPVPYWYNVEFLPDFSSRLLLKTN